MPEPTRLPAREVVRLLQRREISPLELIDAALTRIAAVDPLLNAVPTLCPERARAHAQRVMAAGEPADRRGWLAYLKVEPLLDPLRSDARFTRLLERMRLT